MFPKLKDFTLKMHVMFGSTYIHVWENLFYKQTQSENRNRSAHETLDWM